MECKKALMDFLLFSYFGIDEENKICEDNKAEITELCAKRAYKDLARTVDFVYSTTRLDNMRKKTALSQDKKNAINFENAKAELIKSVCDDIKKFIDELKCINKKQFDDWHSEKCESIKDSMNKATFIEDGKNDAKLVNNNFTYGQAQKWLNMTLKYLWLLDMLPDGLSEDSLHVPIDSFILQALKDSYHVKDITGSGETYYYNKTVAWSALNDSEYKELQDEIKKIAKKENVSPIVWEGSAWIEVAKSRK